MSEDKLQVAGFKAAAVKAGIRGKDRLDIGLIYSEEAAAVAGVFTTSRVKAAPVLLDMERLENGGARAILVNSGIANACTGASGMENARATAKLFADALGVHEDDVFVASTGVIGEQLVFSDFADHMEPLVAGLSPTGLQDVARSMMTTDTVPKTALRTVFIEDKKVTLAGLAKGSGMIMPNMATMLCFVLTDADVSSAALQAMLSKSVTTSFNAITVDGDTSTNDTVLLLANGRAGNPVVYKEQDDFQQALDGLLKDLALQIVADGEGATKLVTILVKGAKNATDAEIAARTIANSALVKTAFFGEDANWGRIIGALGRSGADFDPEKVDILFDGIMMVKDGLGQGKNVEGKATQVLKKKNFTVTVNLKNGKASREIHTCDLSVDYVNINADYRT